MSRVFIIISCAQEFFAVSLIYIECMFFRLIFYYKSTSLQTLDSFLTTLICFTKSQSTVFTQPKEDLRLNTTDSKLPKSFKCSCVKEVKYSWNSHNLSIMLQGYLNFPGLWHLWAC